MEFAKKGIHGKCLIGRLQRRVNGKVFAAIIGAMLLQSCVTVHENRETQVGESLAVSCGKPTWLTGNYGQVMCSFENRSDQWLKVQVKSLTPHSMKNTVRLLDADETADFLKAYAYDEHIKKFHNDVLLGTIMLIGTAAALSSHSHVSNIGGAAAGGAALTALGTEVNRDYDKIARPKGEENRLIGEREFSVPAKLYVKKSVIVEMVSSKDIVDSVEMCFSEPTTECVKLNFSVRSDIQRRRIGL
jgi:hypothetical protein